LFNQDKIGIIDEEILSCSPIVKEKIAFRNSLGFQAQIEDLQLNCCIPKENPKNNITGETVEKVPKSRFDVS